LIEFDWIILIGSDLINSELALSSYLHGLNDFHNLWQKYKIGYLVPKI